MKKQNIKIEQEEEKVPAKILAAAIVELGQAMKKLSQAKLKRETVVVLIHHKTKIPMYQIELVMNNLEQLEEIWLK